MRGLERYWEYWEVYWRGTQHCSPANCWWPLEHSYSKSKVMCLVEFPGETRTVKCCVKYIIPSIYLSAWNNASPSEWLLWIFTKACQSNFVLHKDSLHEELYTFIRTALFWVITQCVGVIPYLRGRTTCWFLLQEQSWPLKIGPTGCPIMSIRNYTYTLRNIPEERSSVPISFMAEAWNVASVHLC